MLPMVPREMTLLSASVQSLKAVTNARALVRGDANDTRTINVCNRCSSSDTIRNTNKATPLQQPQHTQH